MHRSLRVDIGERYGILILMELARGKLAANDFAE
jgi:hypothetical protein